jgi:hypothetical protein
MSSDPVALDQTEHDELIYVSTFAGRTRADGLKRQRFQLANSGDSVYLGLGVARDEGWVFSMSVEQARHLADYIRAQS